MLIIPLFWAFFKGLCAITITYIFKIEWKWNVNKIKI